MDFVLCKVRSTLFISGTTCGFSPSIRESLLSIALVSSLLRPAVFTPCLVVRQNVFLRLPVQHVNIMVCQVDDSHPATGGIDDLRFCG